MQSMPNAGNIPRQISYDCFFTWSYWFHELGLGGLEWSLGDLCLVMAPQNEEKKGAASFSIVHGSPEWFECPSPRRCHIFNFASPCRCGEPGHAASWYAFRFMYILLGPPYLPLYICIYIYMWLYSNISDTKSVLDGHPGCKWCVMATKTHTHLGHTCTLSFFVYV